MDANVLNELSRITGKSIEELKQPVATSEPINTDVANAIKELTKPRLAPEEYSKIFNGELIEGKIVFNKTIMSKKDYNNYLKQIDKSTIWSDPLLYVLFRSENQTEPNFFEWIAKIQ